MNHNKISLKTAIIAFWLAIVPFTLHADYLMGDVDGDERVSIADVTRLTDYLISQDANLINFTIADVDDDGQVSIADVTTLLDLLLSGRNIEVIEVTSAVTIRMVKVSGGSFWMGTDMDQAGEASQWELLSHKVTVSDFSIGETEVTQELWQAVMGSNPSRFTGNAQHPVEGVTWNDCQQFIAKLRQMTGKDFRLPTEAEWEFAASGGGKSKGYKFAGSNDANRVAWWGYNTGRGDCSTHPVAKLIPNELGIHDMSGNVWEWCQDWFAPYSSDEQTNPAGPETGNSKVFRGGCWSGDSKNCRVTERFYFAPTLHGDLIGLRLAL